jgi:hypothetical protein
MRFSSPETDTDLVGIPAQRPARRAPFWAPTVGSEEIKTEPPFPTNPLKLDGILPAVSMKAFQGVFGVRASRENCGFIQICLNRKAISQPPEHQPEPAVFASRGAGKEMGRNLLRIHGFQNPTDGRGWIGRAFFFWEQGAAVFNVQPPYKRRLLHGSYVIPWEGDARFYSREILQYTSQD